MVVAEHVDAPAFADLLARVEALEAPNAGTSRRRTR
jgi:hypothetical protein